MAWKQRLRRRHRWTANGTEENKKEFRTMWRSSRIFKEMEFTYIYWRRCRPFSQLCVFFFSLHFSYNFQASIHDIFIITYDSYSSLLAVEPFNILSDVKVFNWYTPLNSILNSSPPIPLSLATREFDLCALLMQSTTIIFSNVFFFRLLFYYIYFCLGRKIYSKIRKHSWENV